MKEADLTIGQKPDNRSARSGGRFRPQMMLIEKGKTYRDNDCAVAAGATNGHIKVITDRGGDILGATIVGARRRPKTSPPGGRSPSTKTEYRSYCRCYYAISELCRGGKTRRDDIFHSKFDVTGDGTHHSVAAPFWINAGTALPDKALT